MIGLAGGERGEAVVTTQRRRDTNDCQQHDALYLVVIIKDVERHQDSAGEERGHSQVEEVEAQRLQ